MTNLAFFMLQDSSGTRDTTGEPAVTSYHRRFMGTVDYMWLVTPQVSLVLDVLLVYLLESRLLLDYKYSTIRDFHRSQSFCPFPCI